MLISTLFTIMKMNVEAFYEIKIKNLNNKKKKKKKFFFYLVLFCKKI